VGVWFRSQETNRYLYLLRNDSRNPGSWGLPGGKIEPNETLLEGIQRECQEELGSFPGYQYLLPIEKFTSVDEKFEYHTWICIVEREFCPKLNHEHLGYAWIDSGTWPRPMHPGLWNTVNIETIKQKIATVEITLPTMTSA
jgi:8-oxo-dGTP pyrophosphatase MutT (NUDIX family)